MPSCNALGLRWMTTVRVPSLQALAWQPIHPNTHTPFAENAKNVRSLVHTCICKNGAAGEFGPFMKLGAPEKGPGWKEQLAEKKAAAAAAARKEKASYGGKEVFDVPPASQEELLELSTQMNTMLNDPVIFTDPAARDW